MIGSRDFPPFNRLHLYRARRKKWLRQCKAIPLLSWLTAELSKEIYEPFIRWMDQKRMDESATPGECMVASIRIQSAMIISVLMMSTDWDVEKDLKTLESAAKIYQRSMNVIYNEARKRYDEFNSGKS